MHAPLVGLVEVAAAARAGVAAVTEAACAVRHAATEGEENLENKNLTEFPTNSTTSTLSAVMAKMAPPPQV